MPYRYRFLPQIMGSNACTSSQNTATGYFGVRWIRAGVVGTWSSGGKTVGNGALCGRACPMLDIDIVVGKE
jgi:hypothetical protein